MTDEPLPGWSQAWADAQELWGVRMHPPHPHELEGTFAAFTFPSQVLIDVADLRLQGLTGHLVSVFAHELGHHVLAPATRVEGARIQLQMANAVSVAAPDGVPIDRVARVGAMLANLWEDMLINVRVERAQRRAGLTPTIADTWRVLRTDTPDPVMARVLRAYEMLWLLPAGTLAGGPVTPEPVETDAVVLADLVRTYGTDPLGGALRAGLVLGGAFTEDVFGTGCAGEIGGTPLTEIEMTRVLADPRLQEPIGEAIPLSRGHGGQAHDIAVTEAVLGAGDPAAVLRAWYTSRAAPWWRPLRVRTDEVLPEPDLPGPLEVWEAGDELADLDLPASLAAGPVLIPGVTTRRRAMLPDGAVRAESEIDLDLYVDSSGSMPAPQLGSPALLAGVILVGSALAGGGRVRVTSFASAGQVAGCDWTRDRRVAIDAVLHYFGGGTTFPLDLLQRRYTRPQRRGIHLVVLSDDGMTSLFGAGQPDYAHVAADVRPALDSATLVLLGVGRGAAEAAAAGYEIRLVPDLAAAPAVCGALAAELLEGARA